jgi:hypothetical protein
LLNFFNTFSRTSIPPAQSSALIVHEWPSSGNINLTSLRRKSFNEGAIGYEGVEGLNGPRPTANAVGGEGVPPADIKVSSIGDSAACSCSAVGAWRAPEA